MLTNIQIQVLKRISRSGPTGCDGSAYAGKSKLAVLMGNEFFADIAGKVVIDFGCGEGTDAVEMATKGAKRVIGIDIREDVCRQQHGRPWLRVFKVSALLQLRQRNWRILLFLWTLLSISPIPPKFCV